MKDIFRVLLPALAALAIALADAGNASAGAKKPATHPATHAAARRRGLESRAVRPAKQNVLATTLAAEPVRLHPPDAPGRLFSRAIRAAQFFPAAKRRRQVSSGYGSSTVRFALHSTSGFTWTLFRRSR